MLFVGSVGFKDIIGVSKGEGLEVKGRVGRIAGDALAEARTSVRVAWRDVDFDISGCGRCSAEPKRL